MIVMSCNVVDLYVGVEATWQYGMSWLYLDPSYFSLSIHIHSQRFLLVFVDSYIN